MCNLHESTPTTTTKLAEQQFEPPRLCMRNLPAKHTMTGSQDGAQLVANNIKLALKYNKVRFKCANNKQTSLGGGFSWRSRDREFDARGGCSHERASKRVASSSLGGLCRPRGTRSSVLWESLARSEAKLFLASRMEAASGTTICERWAAKATASPLIRGFCQAQSKSLGSYELLLHLGASFASEPPESDGMQRASQRMLMSANRLPPVSQPTWLEQR